MAEGRRAPCAGDYVTSRVPVAAPEDTAERVRTRLTAEAYDSVAEVAVLDGPEFAGLVSIESLLRASAGSQLREIMERDGPPISPDVSDEVAASVIAERGGTSLPVVDSAGRFMGLIPPRGMLEVLLEEHEEDLARIGGFLAGTGRAHQAAEESVRRRLRHRLPWLLIGLVGAMASAVLIGSFERTLDDNVVLALFVPAVVYMADAVGTQTEAILIRGLSVGVTIRDVFKREVATGAITGALVGFAFVPFVLIGWSELDVAIAVGLALFASCSIATLVAMALPWAFQRLGRDPAFGSGPVATVIQDLLSIAVYLAIAIPLAA